MTIEEHKQSTGFFVPFSMEKFPSRDDTPIQYGTPLEFPEYPSEGETILDLLRKVSENFGDTNIVSVEKPPHFASPFSWNRAISHSLDNLLVEDMGDRCFYIFPQGAKRALAGLFAFIDRHLKPNSKIDTCRLRFTYRPQREDDFPYSLVVLEGKLLLPSAPSETGTSAQIVEYSALRFSPEHTSEPFVVQATIGSEPEIFLRFQSKKDAVEDAALNYPALMRTLVTSSADYETVLLHRAYLDGMLASCFPGLFPAGLHECAQGTMYHSERHWLFENGDAERKVPPTAGASVWEHALCVRDQVSKQVEHFLKTPLMTQRCPTFGALIEQCKDVFAWAALLHDIGKIDTRGALVSENVSYPGSDDVYEVTRYPFPGHEERGATILKNGDISPLFSNTTWEDLRHTKEALLYHLVRHHGDTHDSIPKDIELLRNGTATPEDIKRIDAYITPKSPIAFLALVIFHHCDRLAIRRADGNYLPDNEALLREAYILRRGTQWRDFEMMQDKPITS